MRHVADELHQIIEDFSNRVRAIPEDEFCAKPLPHKWSKKEVLGHLIDSAQNNLRRFVCGQYEQQPPFIVYQQDAWVRVNQYQSADRHDIVELWRLLNLRICAVLETMPEENYNKQCNTGSLHTLQWLAADYVKHLKHHLNQIISGSFNVVYVSTI